MSTELIVGLVGFVFFFALWVIVPSLIHKKQSVEAEEE